MGDLGVFEAMAGADRLSVEAAAEQGFELEKSVDRAIFRARERFGAYLANSQSKSEFDERWAQVSNQVIKVIAEVVTPTPKIIRRVGAALRPSLQAQAPTKKTRPSSVKTARAVNTQPEVITAVTQKQASVTKTAWTYNSTTKLWTSNDPMQKFACPGCGTEQDHIGLNKCAGCDREWNTWTVRRAGTDKTSSSIYLLMTREIKTRGDQFKLAAAGNVKVAEMPMQPTPGTMPGDNSAAMGAPVAPEQPSAPMAAAGDHDADGDVAGGITEDSPIDQIQDALQDAVMALKDVQMLSINPALVATSSTKMAKVIILRTAMDRFWALHKQFNYVAGMLAKEANEAIRSADPRITAEAEFVAGFNAAAQNAPLPVKTGRAYLEGYVAFHKQGDAYSDGADYDRIFEPAPATDETTGTRNDGSFLSGTGLDDGRADTSDAGPFDTSQPAQQASAQQIDEDNAQGDQDRGQGQSGSIQPTGARRPLPKGRR